MTVPKPFSESARLAALKRLHVMDSPEEQAYDDIVKMAAALCGTPVALISLVDDKRQWFKARVGTQVRETPREMAFCAHVLQDESGTPLVVNDATQDARFESNPLVTGDPNIRFYAGAPLRTSTGHTLGTVCVIDTRPRELDPVALEQLQFLAQQVVVMLEQRIGAADADTDAGTAG